MAQKRSTVLAEIMVLVSIADSTENLLPESGKKEWTVWKKNLEKTIDNPKIRGYNKEKGKSSELSDDFPGKFSEYSFFLKGVDKIQSILYTIIVKREKGRRQVRSHFLKVNGRCKIIRKKF